jgi:flagellar basal body rod protein FlgC
MDLILHPIAPGLYMKFKFISSNVSKKEEERKKKEEVYRRRNVYITKSYWNTYLLLETFYSVRHRNG